MQISILQLMKGGNIEEMANVLLQKMNAADTAETPQVQAPETSIPAADADKIAA
jgi:hypothetical protein